MTCDERDQDLLLLSHGELPRMRRLMTLAHLYTCPRCRQRQAHFDQISAAMAQTIRGQDLPHWRPLSRPPAPRATVGAGAWLRTASLAILIVLLGLLVYGIVFTISISHHGAKAVQSGPNSQNS